MTRSKTISAYRLDIYAGDPGEMLETSNHGVVTVVKQADSPTAELKSPKGSSSPGPSTSETAFCLWCGKKWI